MTGKAGVAFVYVTGNIFVLVVHIGLCMAGHTGKDGEVVGHIVAIDTFVPFALVCATIDREELTVVIESGRHPPGIGRVAGRTVGWESGCGMVGVTGIVVIVQMTGYTFGRGVLKIVVDMAGSAVGYGMPQCKWEELVVDGGRHPPGIGTVTGRTIGGEIGCLMIGIAGLGIVVGMTGKTIGRNIPEIVYVVAGTAFVYIVSQGEWKEVVIKTRGFPVHAKRIVTFQAIGRKSRNRVIGTGGSQIIVLVALEALVAQRSEPQGGGTVVTGRTIHVAVGAYKREPVLLVKFGDVKDQPAVAIMASHTIISDRLLVHVGMAGDTVVRRILEDQVGMAGPAIGKRVCSFKVETCGGMVECKFAWFDLPSARIVAGGTIDL